MVEQRTDSESDKTSCRLLSGLDSDRLRGIVPALLCCSSPMRSSILVAVQARMKMWKLQAAVRRGREKE